MLYYLNDFLISPTVILTFNTRYLIWISSCQRVIIFNNIFNAVSKISKIYVLFTLLINDWKDNKAWLINKLINIFNTRRKLYLYNTSTWSYLRRTSKSFFFWIFDTLKNFYLFQNVRISIAYERLIDNVILNKYFSKSIQSQKSSSHD